MTDHVTPEKAIAWLEAQLEGLGMIRNASTRDQGFRVWRQETLAFLQQIWPERPGRWARFRRVPFAPSSPRADEKVARETFERGFAEMRRLLKMWIAELKNKGLVAGDDPEETIEEAPKPRKSSAGRPKQPLKAMLGLGQFDLESAPAKSTPPKQGPRSTRAAKGVTGISALANALESLGVPAAERGSVQAALTDFAQRLESGSITWGAMQEAVALVMRYPALARRALPILQPYLDRAA